MGAAWQGFERARREPVATVGMLLVVVCLGCGGTGEVGGGASAQETPDVASAPAKRFFGIESFTVVRKLDGIHTGTVTEHVRDWGNQRVEIRDTELRVGGFSTKQKQKVITEGASITTIDLATGTATHTTNPYYDGMAQSAGKDGVEFGRAMMRAMGGRETGKTRNLAGESCTEWEVAQMGQVICVTDDGLTLYSANSMARISEKATKVRRGDPGPDAAYKVPSGVRVQTAPDLAAIRKRIQEAQASR